MEPFIMRRKGLGKAPTLQNPHETHTLETALVPWIALISRVDVRHLVREHWLKRPSPVVLRVDTLQKCGLVAHREQIHGVAQRSPRKIRLPNFAQRRWPEQCHSTIAPNRDHVSAG
jgi:hypothetical protein